MVRLCDVPRLHLLCFRRIVSEFKVVARSEGWRAMRESDPALEQELLDAVIKADRVSPKVTPFVTVVGSDHTPLWACCEKWHVVSSLTLVCIYFSDLSWSHQVMLSASHPQDPSLGC